MAKIERPRFWMRVGGVGGIVFFVSVVVLIVLMPLSHSVSEPAFDASSSAFLAYATSEAKLPFALNVLGILGLYGFVVFAVVLADKFRTNEGRSNAPSGLVVVAAGVFIVFWLAEFGIRSAETFRHTDLDAVSASILYGLSNGIFVISWAAVAAFLVAAGVASLWSRALPSWLGWAALVIGVALFLAVAAPLGVFWYLPYLLFFIWVLAASVVLLRTVPTT